MIKEAWRSVKGYDGRYLVSNFGRVKSLGLKIKKWNGYKTCNFHRRSKILKQQKVNGYLKVTLCKYMRRKTYSVHRLVIEHFVQNTANKAEINHIDGNKLNNKVDNLEWTSSRDNQIHALKLGLKRSNSKHIGAMKMGNKWEARIKINGTLHRLGKYTTEQEAAVAYSAMWVLLD